MTKLSSYINKIQLILKRYLKGNWGFPFIVTFLLLLLAAAVFLAISPAFASIAQTFAYYSYFALAIGVLFQVGNVNSMTVQDFLVWIKKIKIALQLERSGKNKLETGVVLDGPS